MKVGNLVQQREAKSYILKSEFVCFFRHGVPSVIVLNVQLGHEWSSL